MGNLTEHAKRELQLTSCFSEKDSYDSDIGKAVMQLIKVFAKQGHSGSSALFTIDLFCKLARFQNLTPLTDNPEYWMDISLPGEEPRWQNKRNPSAFSSDGGKTWELLEE